MSTQVPGELSFDEVVKARAKTKGKLGSLGATIPTLAADLADRKAIDGLAFTQLLLGGYHSLAKAKNELNRINVFPLPDGDTGTNSAEPTTPPPSSTLLPPPPPPLSSRLLLPLLAFSSSLSFSPPSPSSPPTTSP